MFKNKSFLNICLFYPTFIEFLYVSSSYLDEFTSI